MLQSKDEELGCFLDDALAKGYIVPSKSPMVLLVFFVKKKDGKLHFVQDYKKLNAVTIKNCYPLLLASNIINHLTKANIFTKFDVRWGIISTSRKQINGRQHSSPIADHSNSVLCTSGLPTRLSPFKCS